MEADGKRTAFITGATGALGETICRSLAAQGLSIVAAYHDNVAAARSIEAALSAIDTDCWPLQLDVASEHDVAHAFADLSDRGMTCSILVCGAGVAPRPVTVADLSVAEWRHTIDVNLTGAFLCAKYAQAGMIAAGFGRIVFVSSIFGRHTPGTRSAYGASKHGLHGLTQALARELGPHGITVNAVCPGPMDTPMVRSVWQAHAEASGATYEAYAKARLANIARGRLATTEDVAAVVRFLVSDEADFVSGALIDVNGGEC